MKALVAGLALTAFLGLFATIGAATSTPFKVSSTLDGKTVLPHRIHWLGYPSLAHADVVKVEFLIDGKLAWVEHSAPYVYGSDDNGRNEGYLVTSWLTPGQASIRRPRNRKGWNHCNRHSRRSRPPGSRTASSALGNLGADDRWRRGAEARLRRQPNQHTRRVWTLAHQLRKALGTRLRPGKFVYPKSNSTGIGFVFLDDYTATATRINVAGEVIFHKSSDKLAEGGWWCYPERTGRRLQLVGQRDTLTLAPVGGRDACAVRGFVWSGQWTRVH